MPRSYSGQLNQHLWHRVQVRVCVHSSAVRAENHWTRGQCTMKMFALVNHDRRQAWSLVHSEADQSRIAGDACDGHVTEGTKGDVENEGWSIEQMALQLFLTLLKWWCPSQVVALQGLLLESLGVYRCRHIRMLCLFGFLQTHWTRAWALEIARAAVAA